MSFKFSKLYECFAEALTTRNLTRIATMGDYAIQTIEAANIPPAHALPFPIYAHNPTKKVVIQTFILSMDTIDSQMSRLRQEAEVSMGHLVRLEEHSSALYELVIRENKELTPTPEEVFAELWTWLGGNRRSSRKADADLDSLKNIEKCRQEALAHVVATVQAIHALGVGVEELRARVAMSGLIVDQIPAEVQLKSIKAGVERLRRETRASAEATGKGYRESGSR